MALVVSILMLLKVLRVLERELGQASELVPAVETTESGHTHRESAAAHLGCLRQVYIFASLSGESHSLQIRASSASSVVYYQRILMIVDGAFVHDP